ncbi:hypothetical protein LX36DRAFT_593669 [Colletotrichum falcatum]|nr:hypothetical protein LX36DRAFT_593669 [Colletotrichum falcatum]
MSSADTTPISPARFAEALRDLSLPTLHLKALEIRNSVLHLRYSNAQLRPYAEGAATTLDAADASAGRPDPDCVDAIRENEAVIDRMDERLRIIRREVEGRGHSWDDFRSKEEVDIAAGQGAAAPADNSPHPAWLDGTFQMGTIRNGEIRMDPAPARPTPQPGGRLSDEELRRAMEERMRDLGHDEGDEDEGGGMHL